MYVGPGKASTDLVNAPAQLAAGATATIGFQSRNACNEPVYPLNSFVGDTVPTRFHTPTPTILGVLDSVYRYNPAQLQPTTVRVVGRAPGTGVLVATYRGGTDTVRISVP